MVLEIRTHLKCYYLTRHASNLVILIEIPKKLKNISIFVWWYAKRYYLYINIKTQPMNTATNFPEMRFCQHIACGTTLSGRVFFYYRNREGKLKFGVI